MTWLAAGLSLGAALLMPVLIYLWSKEKTARKIAARETDQIVKDAQRNKKSNENYSEKAKSRKKRVGDIINPSDPWSGVR